MTLEPIHEIVLYLHSGLRWLLVGVAGFTVIYLAFRLIFARRYDDLSARLITSISALMVLEWVIGIIFVVLNSSVTGTAIQQYITHSALMTLALVAACLHFFLRRRGLNTTAIYRLHLALIVVVCVLIAIGIGVLPQEIRWRFYPAAGV